MFSGSAYIEISPPLGTTDDVPEGINNLYLTEERVINFSPIKSVSGKIGDVELSVNDLEEF